MRIAMSDGHKCRTLQNAPVTIKRCRVRFLWPSTSQLTLPNMRYIARHHAMAKSKEELRKQRKPYISFVFSLSHALSSSLRCGARVS